MGPPAVQHTKELVDRAPLANRTSLPTDHCLGPYPEKLLKPCLRKLELFTNRPNLVGSKELVVRTERPGSRTTRRQRLLMRIERRTACGATHERVGIREHRAIFGGGLPNFTHGLHSITPAVGTSNPIVAHRCHGLKESTIGS